MQELFVLATDKCANRVVKQVSAQYILRHVKYITLLYETQLYRIRCITLHYIAEHYIKYLNVGVGHSWTKSASEQVS